ncbi:MULTISPECIES: NAD(+)/NADH kinase [unclassified Variovorax]|uniref:NAD(+)/NADH kinase n=1 Tax=unclassified Variovorax TaxID=663243 RepID=UPI00076C6739|nr:MULTISPECIES: NAD(+)/NADH kinase [unclassified Variovorax]KWT98498.1 NAD kinase [Variovorax sp. WDL1]PNG49826.1 NAD kinase [Variovorax sp. B2]PNG50698.1 NAD kinase [Variovorax sp. B4]VTU42437.1 putative inorganic polyphosphate/ATP-NAD kinase [Variovorax sp. PBL-H6]VTU43939.1 putative inorganic polyphosphate/ATP-NAD kinase [Variovorax sp. SRS16]
MTTLALFSKPNNPHAWGVLNEIVSWAQLKGLRVLVGPDKGGWDGKNWSSELIESARQEADIAIAIGGDGTLLGVARNLFGWGKPILGVNLGTLGFLTDVAAKDIERMLDAIQAGEYTVEDRILLEAGLDGEESRGLAFNDVVFTNGGFGRLAQFDVFVDEQPVFSLRADGLIITTPTGSTAYALSANGPILHPSLAAIALVPLNPHSLTARPISLPSSVKVEVVVRGTVESRVVCDGQPYGGPLTDGTRVHVSQGATTVKMLHLKDYNLFKTLQQKLNWSSPRER